MPYISFGKRIKNPQPRPGFWKHLLGWLRWKKYIVVVSSSKVTAPEYNELLK